MILRLSSRLVPTLEAGHITSGFVGGLNTIESYVQGNGQTDGFALELVSFTAVPTPGAATVLGLGGLLAVRRRR